jgi:DNA helicase-2/ATP-dependent DNA helicase PcrA
MSTNRTKLLETFNTEYLKLNANQRLAVNTIEGPVMVIAGPGTGKTQILASRIGKILLETDTLPENILCLTYTDAGVVAMRKRLLQFIGPDAYKVNIYTFHAFCNDVIQDNLSMFEKNSLDAISELERIELFKKLIDTLPKNHPLKRYRGDVYYEVSNLQGLFSNMKKEGWTPDFLNQHIDEHLKELPNDEAFIYKTSRAGKYKKGDFKPDYYEELEKMEKLRAAVNEFDRFQQMMKDANRYDFDDMIIWVIKAFENNTHLLANYQERFQYILVDEYQDTSGSQNNLVQLLISYWENPNVFVVGDDDQSIFRFQGANVENMLTFATQYNDDILKVVLTNNYRSTQPILDASKALIDRNNDRLINKIEGLTKTLISSNDKIQHLNHLPIVIEYESQRHEMIAVVKNTQKLLAEGVEPGKIGIIYKENKYGEVITQYFNLLNIPVYSKRHMNALELPLARKIISILKYLAAEHFIPYSGDQMLFEILHFDWFKIPPIEISKITMEVADRRFGDRKTSIRALMQDKINSPQVDLFNKNISDELASASKIIESLISSVSNVTLQFLFEQIIREAGVISTIMQSKDKHWQLQVLTALFDFIKEETHRKPLMRLQDLVTLIELMEQESLPIPLVQVSGSDKGVNLMTAHGSKGLEFKYVFIVGANADLWEKKRANNRGYKIPPNVFSTISNAKDNEELRRLFYVAITRAEQHLFISYSKFKTDGKEIEPSMFIAEIQETFKLPVEKISLDEETISIFAALNFAEGQAPEIAKLEDDIITPLLDKFVMNVTALNGFLKCPLSFYYNNFIRIPSAKNESTEFGSAVHFALEQLFKRMVDNPTKEFPSKDSFNNAFEWYMHRNRESFSQEQFNRRMEYGIEVLSKYYDTHIQSFNKVVVIEHSIKGVTVGNVPIKGKLDKIEFDGKNVNVVDYKSGNPENGLKKLDAPNDKEPNGGDYWRQAVFYKILVDNKSGKDWTAVSSEFDFIEPDTKKIYKKKKLVISPEDITTVTQQITTTWEKIQNKEFYIGCGKPACTWCNFVKTNNLAVILHNADDTEEI